MQTFESLTIANTVTSLTAALYEQRGIKFNKALITIETAPVRVRVDGVAPTTTLGHLLNAGDTLNLQSNDEIKKFRGIRTTGTSGVAMITYSVKDE